MGVPDAAIPIRGEAAPGEVPPKPLEDLGNVLAKERDAPEPPRKQKIDAVRKEPVKLKPQRKKKPLFCGDFVCCGKRKDFLSNSGVKCWGCYWSIGIFLAIAIGFGIWGLVEVFGGKSGNHDGVVSRTNPCET